MASPFENPAVRYALALGNTAILAGIGLIFFDGLIRWIILAMAATEMVIVPTILKMSVNQADQLD